METGRIVEIVVTIAGIVIVISSFWFLSVKKMTANFVVIWEIIGVALVMLGGTFRLSVWGTMIYEDGEHLAICISVAGLFICYQFSLVVSSLLMKNHEMAMEVSMLLQEKNETFKIPEKDLLIILPVKNEEKNIRKLLEQLFCPEIGKIADVLCVNDGSKDRSGQVIDEYPCIQIRNIFGLGYGSSLQLGYKYALRKGYQYVIQMDADGQHDVCNIPDRKSVV